MYYAPLAQLGEAGFRGSPVDFRTAERPAKDGRAGISHQGRVVR